MEKGQQTLAATDTPAVTTVASTPFAQPDYAPPHTKTESTLAPTSEYVRYLLLALPARYIPRGIVGTLFETNGAYEGNRIARAITDFGKKMQAKFNIKNPDHTAALAYTSIMGVGSLAMTATYSWTVYKDIKNIFSEAVAEETGKPVDKINFADLKRSDNRIVQKTMENFWSRSIRRGLTDLLFFPAALLRRASAGDLMVGIKAAQAYGETWKRKTTMFEDLVTFINNKINPRNGLGQAISVGEIFDLYQHYSQEYTPGKAFTNVIERGTGEGALWAQSQQIFLRMTELMNLTYAYKHSSLIDPKTGHAIHQADFALPKFIYLLGHDLIDVNKPEQTLATIEIANRFGIGAVKDMQAMLAKGSTLAQVTERFPIPAQKPIDKKNGAEKNGVIAKGSTMQLDMAETPMSKIDPASVQELAPLVSSGLAIA